MERLTVGLSTGTMSTTCSRFATVDGVAPRMRFDLTATGSRVTYRLIEYSRCSATAPATLHPRQGAGRADYRVTFDKIRAELGFATLMTVPDGVAEPIWALD